MPGITVARAPLMRDAVAAVRSGVHDESYSPESRYTGHRVVSMRGERSSKWPSYQ